MFTDVTTMWLFEVDEKSHLKIETMFLNFNNDG